MTCALIVAAWLLMFALSGAGANPHAFMLKRGEGRAGTTWKPLVAEDAATAWDRRAVKVISEAQAAKAIHKASLTISAGIAEDEVRVSARKALEAEANSDFAVQRAVEAAAMAKQQQDVDQRAQDVASAQAVSAEALRNAQARDAESEAEAKRQQAMAEVDAQEAEIEDRINARAAAAHEAAERAADEMAKQRNLTDELVATVRREEVSAAAIQSAEEASEKEFDAAEKAEQEAKESSDALQANVAKAAEEARTDEKLERVTEISRKLVQAANADLKAVDAARAARADSEQADAEARSKAQAEEAEAAQRNAEAQRKADAAIAAEKQALTGAGDQLAAEHKRREAKAEKESQAAAAEADEEIRSAMKSAAVQTASEIAEADTRGVQER